MELTGEEINDSKHSEKFTENSTAFDQEKEKFTAIFPEIVSGVVDSPMFAKTPDIARRLKKLIEYNSAGGHKVRGLMTVRAYQMLEDPEKLTEKTLRLARILGWCVELFQTSLVLLDDMADNSPTRRGAVCWYRLPDAGLFPTINDSLFLLSVVFEILKENFGDAPCYPQILETFMETMRHLCMGQYEQPPKDYSRFTIEHFKNYSNNRRTYYTYRLPIYTSLLLANKPDKKIFDNVEDILVDMALLLSMQNDYDDCFGDESVTGKAGTDIQEGKCSWLAVTALQRCSAEQRAQFVACYGNADAASALSVKRLYEQLQLPAFFRDTERASYDCIVARINKLPADNKLPPAMLLELFNMSEQMRVD